MSFKITNTKMSDQSPLQLPALSVDFDDDDDDYDDDDGRNECRTRQ